MKVRSLEEMLAEYKTGNLESIDRAERNEMLLKHQYSIIIEGGFLEFETLDKWIKINLKIINLSDIYYRKTDYDFGFRELFFDEEIDLLTITRAVPYIYSVYPLSYPSGQISKSDGRQKEIIYDPSDERAIILKD